MARKTDRNFLADFATLNIEYLPEKGPEVSNDVQMVYVMGDVSAQAAPGAPNMGATLGVPVDQATTVVMDFISGVAAEQCTAQLLVDPGLAGAWVSPLASGSEVPMLVWIDAAPDAGLTVVTPTLANSVVFGVGTLPVSQVHIGTAAQTVPTFAWQARMSQESGIILYRDLIFVGPNRTIKVAREGNNIAAILGMLWREIPL